MAFRKTVQCSSKVSAFFGGFHERKTVSRSDGSGVGKQELRDVSVHELASTTLPLVSLSDVQSSGQYIQGNVDFTPNDPVTLNHVESVLQDFVNDYLSNKSKNETSNNE